MKNTVATPLGGYPECVPGPSETIGVISCGPRWDSGRMERFDGARTPFVRVPAVVLAGIFQVRIHSRCVPLLRLLGNGWAAFFVTKLLGAGSTRSTDTVDGQWPDGLIMPQARDRAPVHNFADTSFGFCSGVSSLVE